MRVVEPREIDLVGAARDLAPQNPDEGVVREENPPVAREVKELQRPRHPDDLAELTRRANGPERLELPGPGSGEPDLAAVGRPAGHAADHPVPAGREGPHFLADAVHHLQARRASAVGPERDLAAVGREAYADASLGEDLSERKLELRLLFSSNDGEVLPGRVPVRARPPDILDEGPGRAARHRGHGEEARVSETPLPDRELSR